MIAGIFHQGSGLGNQLHRYVATRVLALDKECGWAMIDPSLFKGWSFMNIQTEGTPHIYFNSASQWDTGIKSIYFNEKKVVENGVDIRAYDPEINFVEDNTIIDGEFQDERYWAHREKEVREWLKVEPLDIPDDLCIIGFRGGEYSIFPDLFLTYDYWQDAVKKMKQINPNMRFEVHTDDILTAKAFFPEYDCVHDIGLNWRSIRYAKYSIIANSSFYILPRWLRHGEGEALTVGPRYWARRNTKTWALPSNFYKRFTYI